MYLLQPLLIEFMIFAKQFIRCINKANKVEAKRINQLVQFKMCQSPSTLLDLASEIAAKPQWSSI